MNWIFIIEVAGACGWIIGIINLLIIFNDK